MPYMQEYLIFSHLEIIIIVIFFFPCMSVRGRQISSIDVLRKVRIFHVLQNLRKCPFLNTMYAFIVEYFSSLSFTCSLLSFQTLIRTLPSVFVGIITYFSRAKMSSEQSLWGCNSEKAINIL